MQRVRNAPPRYWLVVLVIVLLLGLPTVIDSFLTSEWAQVLILAIAIMGLNILVGYSGQLSLGHGAFMALGAYISAILAHRYKVDYLLTIPIAALATGLVGFVLGIPALRLSALYLALATFAASGVNIAGYKTLAFGISAFYAGTAGSLFGLATGYISPDTFPVSLSIQLLVGAVIGGLASIPGPLLGAIVAFFLPIESNQWVPSQSWIPDQIASTIKNAGPAVSYGVLLILIMIFAPNGLVGLVRQGYEHLNRRLRGAGDREAGQFPPDAQTV